MADSELLIRIAALYQFTVFDACEAMRAELVRLCTGQGVKGTVLLAREGINGTIAGSEIGIEAVLAYIRTLPGCAGLQVKESWAARMPFFRMKVRIKPEIVTMGQPDIDPVANAGKYVQPQAWNALLDQPDTILIDTRNEYEVAIGTFANAINPRTMTFRDFPAWFRTHREALLKDRQNPKVAMFCTGGIRCEKATAFLKSEGVEEVYHLQGGILKYLEVVPPDQSRWTGECFVFDQRVSVGHGLKVGTHDVCHACRTPVSPADRTSPQFVAGISCPSCHAVRNDMQRASYAERERQVQLAQARGESHIGIVRSIPEKRGDESDTH